MKRSQLILNDLHDRRLREMASSEGKSISEVVRQILDDFFARLDRQRQEQTLKALAELDQIREATARYGVYEGDPVNEAREERDQETEELWDRWS